MVVGDALDAEQGDSFCVIAILLLQLCSAGNITSARKKSSVSASA